MIGENQRGRVVPTARNARSAGHGAREIMAEWPRERIYPTPLTDAQRLERLQRVSHDVRLRVEKARVALGELAPPA